MQEHEIRKLILEKLLEKGSIPSFLEQPVGSGGINDIIRLLLGEIHARQQNFRQTCR